MISIGKDVFLNLQSYSMQTIEKPLNFSVMHFQTCLVISFLQLVS